MLRIALEVAGPLAGCSATGIARLDPANTAAAAAVVDALVEGRYLTDE